jgi:hypothetical protein
MKKVLEMYGKLCDEYNNKNYQRLCSLQTFLQTKMESEKNPFNKAIIREVIKYAETDF